MATLPQAPPQGAPQAGPPQGPPQSAPGMGSGASPAAVVQIMDGITKLSDMLGQIFPAASEEVQGIQRLVGQAQSKIAAAARPTQPAAPPI